MDCSPPGSSVHGIFQARVLEWGGVAFPSASCSVMSKSLWPMNYSPPDSSVHGISQARILEWLPFPSPGDLPDLAIEPGFPAWQAYSLPSEPPWKPWYLRTGPYLEIGFILKMWKVKMWPSGWVLTQDDWCPYKKKSLGTQMYTEGRPWADTGRKEPSRGQGEGSQEDTTAPAPGSPFASHLRGAQCLL